MIWLHCNECGLNAAENGLNVDGYKLTHCGHIFCFVCADKMARKCSMCGASRPQMLSPTNKAVEFLFRDNVADLRRLHDSVQFQMSHQRHFDKMLAKRARAAEDAFKRADHENQRLRQRLQALRGQHDNLLVERRKNENGVDVNSVARNLFNVYNNEEAMERNLQVTTTMTANATSASFSKKASVEFGFSGFALQSGKKERKRANGSGKRPTEAEMLRTKFDYR